MDIILKKKTYKDYLNESMNLLSKDKRTVFLGQSVSFTGNAIFNTLIDVPNYKKIELPVFEETQMGLSIGLALEGLIPISTYPRFDFLLLAINQLVNHLDKFEYLSGFMPKVIIRTSIGSKIPLDGGPQHTNDHSKAFRQLLDNVRVINLINKNQILNIYKKALNDKYSYLIIENGDEYNK